MESRTRTSRLRGLAWLGAALLLPLALVHAREPSRLDPALALATFDEAWRLVDESPYDVRGKGIDWAAVRERYRPQAAAARDMQALRRSLLAMLETLGESHFSLIPASVERLARGDEAPAPTGSDGAAPAIRDVGLQAGLVEDVLAVTAVREGSPAASAGIRPGWVIETVDGQPIASVLAEIAKLQTEALRRSARLRLEAAIDGRLASSRQARAIALTLRDGGGQRRVLTLQPASAPGSEVSIPLLPPLVFDFESRRLPLPDGGCAGLIRFNVWVPALAEAFPPALAQLRDCRGLVIDLRGNPGGVIGTAMGVGGHLVQKPTPLGYVNAGGSQARLPALPRRVADNGHPFAPYDGPLALLIDSGSASTSEVFASGLQAAARARVFGTRSAGMALPSVTHPLPNGDRLQYAIADLTAPNGERLEGRGIQPDKIAEATLADLSRGRDNALAAALDWLSTLPPPAKEPRP